MGTITCSNGSNVWNMIPRSNRINRKGILRIQLGTDGDWENILNNIYCENSPDKLDCADDRVNVNGIVRYESPMTDNPKP